MKAIMLIGLLLFGGSALAQTEEDQAIWLRLAVLTTCDDRTEHMHIHGFSHDGTSRLVEYKKQSDEEMNRLAGKYATKICADRSRLITQQQLAASLKAWFDDAAQLRHEQIAKIDAQLSADDKVAWATFRDEDRGAIVVSDPVTRVLSGELPMTLVFERVCAVGEDGMVKPELAEKPKAEGE